MSVLVLVLLIAAIAVASRAKPKVEAPIAKEPSMTELRAGFEGVKVTGGFASEPHIQSAITAGTIPPPPQDIPLTPDGNGWFWDGKWESRARHGFEAQLLQLHVDEDFPKEMIAG